MTRIDAGSQVRAGALISYATVAFNALCGLLYTPWLVASLGEGDYGLYTLAWSAVNLFVMDFGIGEALTRFVTKLYAQGDRAQANRILGFAAKLYLAIDVALFVVLAGVYVLAGHLYMSLTADELHVFKGLFAIAALGTVVSFPLAPASSALYANERFVALGLSGLAQKVLMVGLIVAALLLGLDVYAVVAINAGTGVILSMARVVLVTRLTDARPDMAPIGRGRAREVLSFSLWSLAVQLSQRLIFTIMPSILAVFTGTWQIAVFGLAGSLEGYVWNVANALNGMFMPRVARILEGDDARGHLQELVVRMGRIQLVIIGFIVLAFATIGADFVRCWVGDDLALVHVCALLLMAPQLVELPFMVAGTAVVSAGEVRARGIVYLGMAAINVGLGAVLVSAFGLVGACVSIFVSYVARTAGMLWIYSRRLGLDLGACVHAIYPSWLPSAAVLLAVGAAALLVNPLAGWLGFIAESVVVICAYFASCWLFSFNDYERGLVRAIPARMRAFVARTGGRG